LQMRPSQATISVCVLILCVLPVGAAWAPRLASALGLI
jgi:hypothetical protein